MDDPLDGILGSGSYRAPRSSRMRDREAVNKLPDVSPSGMARGATDVANLAGNSFFLGLPNQVAGVRKGIQEFAGGGEFGEGYKKGRAEHEGSLDATRDNLGPIQSFLVEMAAAIPRVSGPGMIASLIEKQVGAPKKVAGFRNLLGRAATDLWKGGAVGAAEGMATNLISTIGTGKDFMESVAQVGAEGGLKGFGSGVAAQAILGNAAPLLYKYGLTLSPRKVMARQKVGEELLDTGPAAREAGGVTPDTVRAEYARMVMDDVGLLETGAGTANPADLSNRIADAVAKTSFPKTSYAENFDTNAENYLETMGYVKRIFDETSEGITRRFRNTLGEARDTTAQRGRNLKPRLRQYAKNYESLTSSQPGSAGAAEIPYQATVDRFGQRLATSLGRNKPEELPDSAAEIYEVVKRALQPKIRTPNTRELRAAPDISLDPDHGVDYSGATAKVADLMAARSEISSKYKAGAFLDGTSVSKERAAHAAAALKILDEEIAARAGGIHDDARAGYAKWLQAKDAEETGAMFFDRRLSEDPEFGEAMQAYMGRFADNPKAVEGFKEGYRRAMMKAIDDGAPLKVMQDIIGELPSNTTPRNIVNIKSTGLKNMRTVLGDETTDTLLREFADDTDHVTALGKLQTYMQTKTETGGAAFNDIKRDMDELLVTAGFAPGNANVLTTSTIGALGRISESFGYKEAELLTALAGKRGEAAVSEIEQMLRTVETPSRVSAGHLGGALTSEDAPELEQPNEQGIMEMLEAYLNSQPEP